MVLEKGHLLRSSGSRLLRAILIRGRFPNYLLPELVLSIICQEGIAFLFEFLVGILLFLRLVLLVIGILLVWQNFLVLLVKGYGLALVYVIPGEVLQKSLCSG